MLILKMLLKTSLLMSLLSIFLYSSAVATEIGSEALPNRDELKVLFKNALALNEGFKESVGRSDYKKKREEIEAFNEEVLFPKMKDVKTILSSGRDMSIAIDFFTLVISYENSVDETLAYTMGEIFLNNPDLIEEAFDAFEKSKQKILYKQLEWGWKNIIFQKNKSDEKIIRLSQRLYDLKIRIGSE